MAIWKITKEKLYKLGSLLNSACKTIIKISLYLLLLIYVIIGVASLGIVIEREYIRSKDITETNRIVDDAITTNRYQKLDKWIRYRKVEDIEKMIDVFEEKSSYLSPTVFFRISASFFNLQNVEEGLFWFNLAKYRLRYDVLRCGASNSILSLGSIINIAYDTDMGELYDSKKEIIRDSLKRVIEFDKKHPPQNDMEPVCFMVSQIEGKQELDIAPEEKWEDIRKKLIKSAKEFVNNKGK